MARVRLDTCSIPFFAILKTMSPPNHAPPETRPLEPDKLIWAVLLGQWIQFARSALALPDDPEGQRLAQSVSDVIMLQAVWFALQHLDELDVSQRAVGIDRSDLLIERHAEILSHRYSEHPMPPLICQLIEEAREQLATARHAPGSGA